MLAICKKNLRLCFSGLFGYAVIAVQLGAFGLFFLLLNLLPASADLSYPLVAMQWVLIALVPLLTARTATREKAGRTEALLFSLPLSPMQILLGNYLSVLCLLLIPTALAALFPLLLAAAGSSSSLASAYTAWFGYLLLVCAVTAVCFFVSSFARRPLTAYLSALASLLVLAFTDLLAYVLPSSPWLSFVICLLAALGSSVWLCRRKETRRAGLAFGGGSAAMLLLLFAFRPSAFSSLIPRFLNAISLFARFDGFAHGYLDLSALLFDLTLIAGCLFLTLQHQKSRRAEPLAQRITPPVTVAVLLAAILFHSVVGLLPYRLLRPSVNPTDPFSLSGESADLLQELNGDVTLHFVYDGDTPDGEIYRFLLSYADHSSRIRVNPVSPKQSPSFPSEHGLSDWPETNSILVESEKRSRLVEYTDLFFYYCYDSYYGYGITMTPAEYQSALSSFAQESSPDELSAFVLATTAYFDGHTAMANALRYVTKDEILTVCVLRGTTGGSTPDAALTKQLLAAGCDLYTLLSATEIPDGCDVLLLHTPTSDLSEAEAASLSDYLAAGGKLFLTTHYDYRDLPRLHAILATYGMRVSEEKDVVLEGDPVSVMTDASGSYPECFYTRIRSSHAATGNFDGTFLTYLAHPIETEDVAGVTLTSWLYSSEKAVRTYYDRLKKEWIVPEETASYTVGAIAERGDSAIVWISSPYPLTSSYNTLSNGGNFALIRSALGALGGTDTEILSQAPSAIDPARLTKTSFSSTLLQGALLLFVLPLGTLAVGAAAVARRKKRT